MCFTWPCSTTQRHLILHKLSSYKTSRLIQKNSIFSFTRLSHAFTVSLSCPLVFHRCCFNEETDLLTISRKGPSRTSMGSPWKPLLLLSVISGLAGTRVRLYQYKKPAFLKTVSLFSQRRWQRAATKHFLAFYFMCVMRGLLALHCPRIRIICSSHNTTEVLSWTVSMVMAWLSKHQIT